MTDHAKKQRVLQQLNSQLQSRRAGALDLGVTGSKLPLLEPTKSCTSVHDIKPSRIPRPSTPSRPLPPPGYVSESLTAHRNTPHTPPSTGNRYLARKYGQTWIKKVYGRLHPFTAKTHYTHTLVRGVWHVWCEKWWAARREWKLNIRAECHDRYRLWQLVWNAWTQYTSMCREKKRIYKMANQFSSHQLTRLVWSGWCEYMSMRRVERTAQSRAEQWRTTQLLRHVWVRWRGGVDCMRKRQAMGTQALHHWAHRLTEKVWQHWLVRLHTRQVLKVHEEVAVKHHHQTMLLHIWTAWLDYVQVRRDKKAMKGLSMRLYCSRLLSRTFEDWKTRLERAQEIAQFQELIIERGQVAVKRRAYQSWRFFISLCCYKDHLVQLSAQVSQLSLKRRALRRLRDYCEQQQREAADGQLASQHHTGKLLLNCWRVWLCGCEHREEIKMGPQTRMAQHHFSMVINKKVLIAWVQYTLHQRERNRLKRIADEQFKNNALPRCFHALRVNVEMQLYQIELRETAEGFRRETLLSMVFYKWWRESQLSQDLRMLERVAILHNEETQKKQLLKLWRTRTRQRVRHLAREATAVTHCRLRMIGVAFQRWHSRLQGLVTRRKQLTQASDHYGNKIVGVVWSAWKKYIFKRRYSKEGRAIADAHYTRVIINHLLHAWKAYVLQCRAEKAMVLKAYNHFNVVLKRRVLHLWVDWVCVAKSERELCSVAITHFKTVTLKKYLSVWLNRTAESIDNRQQEEELLEQSTHHLMKSRLSRILRQWRDYSIEARCARLASETADAHYAAVLKRKCFGAWWEYRWKSLRGALLARQGEWFLKNRLISNCYSQWRVQLMHSLVMKQKSVCALWHWSQWLQRRCLAAWLLHTLEQRRKRERYTAALDRHRRRLVTLGVTQWIKVATQMQSQREAIALQHQTKNAQSVLKCMRRCAGHWLELTRRNRHHPQATRKPRAEAECTVGLIGDGESAVRLTSGDDECLRGDWTSLLKNLQLTDGSHRGRPQPRRPNFTSQLSHTHTTLPTQHSHKDNHPRQPLVPTPHQQAQALQQNSYTFLTSTCTEPSQDQSTDSSQRTYIVETPCLQREGDNTMSHTTDHLPEPLQLVNTHPTVHFADQTIHRPVVDTVSLSRIPHQVANPFIHVHQQQSRTIPTQQPFSNNQPRLTTTSSAHASDGDKKSDSSLPHSLAHPCVQRELVQIRDTLRQFHQLKSNKKALERRLSSLGKQGNSEEQLKQELASLSATICSKEPMIKQCALRLNQLLTQSEPSH